MCFISGKEKEFREIFEQSKDKIRGFEGCTHLELLNDVQHPNVFFTYSKWESEKHLDNYRHSELFNSTWNKTKVLFSEKPEAWTVQIVQPLES